MTEALAVCRHCLWGQHRGNKEDVLEMVEKHLQTGHDVDVRFYNPDIECPIELGKDPGRLSSVERKGELK